jgi:signal-transduction protein with cAMP-binding, CBS, and nucleotidyltransferase domain
LHEDTVMALEEFELFAGMKPSDLALLKTVAREEIYQKDDRIIETGAPGRGLFLIAQGQVKISLRLANGQTTMSPRWAAARSLAKCPSWTMPATQPMATPVSTPN